MDLDALPSAASSMSSAELQRERARLNEKIRKAKRSTTLRYDEGQQAELQTLEVKLHVVQTEITNRTESNG